MTENKIFCSADEYAWLEEGLASAERSYDRTQKAKPGTVVAESASKHLSLVNLYKTALEQFAIRPGSVRSDGHMVLTPEFGEEFGKLPGATLNLVPIVIDEAKVPNSTN